jgi:hypothetical protein
VKTLLGLLIGVPVGWGARSVLAMLEGTDHLPSTEDAMAVLGPIWDAMDAEVVA